MSFPVGPPPDNAFVWGSRFGQDITEQSAKATMAGGVEVEWTAAHESQHTNVSIDSPLWKTMGGDEEATFPRANLNYGSATSTSSGGSGDSSHSHNMSRIPEYQPSGNGNDFLEIGFIRIQKHSKLDTVGFITGNSETWLGIDGAYISVYKVDPVNGDMNKLFQSSNIRDLVTTKNSETRIGMGMTIDARQGEVYAVGHIQDTHSQFPPMNTASLMMTTITDLGRGETGVYPRKAYAYYGPVTSSPVVLPEVIPESQQRFDASTKLPFFFLRRSNNF